MECIEVPYNYHKVVGYIVITFKSNYVDFILIIFNYLYNKNEIELNDYFKLLTVMSDFIWLTLLFEII